MYRSRRDVPWLDNGKLQNVPWEPVDEEQVRKLISHLDPNSFVPRSETLEKGLILKLLALGAVGPEYALAHIGIPDLEDANKERNSNLFQVWKMMQQKGSKMTSRVKK